jgi:RNA polymerase sigma-70 factor (ECF subfamily)
LRAYLYRIAHNWIVDLYRDPQQISALDESLPGEEFTEDEAAKRIRQTQLRKVIRHLTADQQKVITLKYLEDWSNEEIAQALQKPVGAIKAIQHRALVSLQKLLSEDTNEQST